MKTKTSVWRLIFFTHACLTFLNKKSQILFSKAYILNQQKIHIHLSFLALNIQIFISKRNRKIWVTYSLLTSKCQPIVTSTNIQVKWEWLGIRVKELNILIFISIYIKFNYRLYKCSLNMDSIVKTLAIILFFTYV